LVKSDKSQVIHVAGLDGPGLVTPEDAKRMRSRVVVLEPGKEVGEHTTEDREELLIVLEGKVVLVGPDGEHPIVPGQAAFIPLGTLHNVINRTKVPARYMYVLALYDEYSKIKGHAHGHGKHHHH
jgi:mannose-6-phosphate isomerase-like protein (cupin superfamily)